ncbi:MAG TPA: tyrosine-type recombinase/integrase [Burkholderiaceae bacterium]|nr:tyrosine-type recombinase/integrase [Burkholderiaceae bacterium]
MSVKTHGYILNNGIPYFQRAVPTSLRDRFGKATIKIRLKASGVQALAECRGHWDRYTALFQAMKGDETLVPSQTKLAAMALLQANGLQQGDGSKAFPRPVGVTGEWDGDAHTDVFADVLSEMFDGKPNAVSRTAMQALNSPLPLLLSEVFDAYKHHHSKGSDPKFVAKQQAYWGNLVKFVGDIALEGLTRDQARRYRDHRLSLGLQSSSVTKEVGVIRAIINSALTELSLNIRNPFEKITVASTKEPDDDGKAPYSREDVQLLVNEARAADDEKRRIVLVLAVTGARLAEIVGLRRKDIDLEAQVIRIQAHSSRSVKTKTSNRLIPLLPLATEALKAQLEAHTGEYVFPTYANSERTNANSASAALNKWAKQIITDDNKTMHSFRHTLRDRLRAVQCPEPIAKAIGGWSSNNDVSVGYGTGYSLEVTREWLTKAYQWVK